MKDGLVIRTTARSYARPLLAAYRAEPDKAPHDVRVVSLRRLAAARCPAGANRHGVVGWSDRSVVTGSP
jgi:hypothetical protein